MNFSAFHTFNAAFEQKFAHLSREYPFAMMMLEKQLRNHESGSVYVAKQNMQKMERGNFGRTLRALAVLYFSRRLAVPSYYLKLDRFDALETGLKPMLASAGLKAIDDQKHLRRLATSGNALPRFMRKARVIGAE